MTLVQTIDAANTHVGRRFGRSFASYHMAATEQVWIAEQLADRLFHFAGPCMFEHGLELGCGTGHLTQALRRRFELKAMTLNDLTAEAADTAQRFGANFLCGDASRIDWPDRPDLIASASMIQWLSHPRKFVETASARLRPGGYLALSSFGPSQYQELVALGTAPRAPGLSSPSDLALALPQDLELLDLGQACRTAWFRSPRDVLKHLRATGVNGRASKGWTKSDLTRFSNRYIGAYRTAKGVPLTYHPTWIIARKIG